MTEASVSVVTVKYKYTFVWNILPLNCPVFSKSFSQSNSNTCYAIFSQQLNCANGGGVIIKANLFCKFWLCLTLNSSDYKNDMISRYLVRDIFKPCYFLKLLIVPCQMSKQAVCDRNSWCKSGHYPRLLLEELKYRIKENTIQNLNGN